VACLVCGLVAASLSAVAAELGTPLEILAAFGGKDQFLLAVRELEEHLYSAA
jgi:hypothetical protein